jgi:hypothetical protein
MIEVRKNLKRTPVTISEVAVLMPRTGEEVTNGKCDIVLHHRHVGFQRISDLSSTYAPLCYPLIFLFGRQGWHIVFQE